MTSPAAPVEIPVVWLAPRPSAEATRALEQWARGRGVVLRPPSGDRSPVVGVDPSLATAIEAGLEEARRAVAALDADAVARALAGVEAALVAHPELPQAAWLRAEAWRTWSARWARIDPKDLDKAADAWSRAAALDGDRAAGVGETAYPRAPGSDPIDTTLVVEGALPSEPVEVYVDGVRTAPGSVRCAVGDHQIVAMHERGVAFAAWVDVVGGAPIRVTIPPSPICSTDDLGARSSHGVRCPRWVAATPLADGARIASCAGDRCGPADRVTVPLIKGPDGPDKKPWPAWVTWGAVGVGAVALTGVVLWAAGAFDGPERSTRFVSGGVREAGSDSVKPLLVF
ncbi:MAG: hypothetical protein JWM74_2592 [Myxococcaceae bacterium]|nr:hypothetical protein [Myxococcaceae bacterium]